MKNIYVKDIKEDLIKIFIKAGIQSNIGVSSNIIELYQNKLVSDFFIALMTKKEIGCVLLYYMYRQIAELLNLTNFYGRPFIKIL